VLFSRKGYQKQKLSQDIFYCYGSLKSIACGGKKRKEEKGRVECKLTIKVMF
jgi:hypothetical protein